MPKITPQAGDNAVGRGRPHQSVLANVHEEPERITPCRYEPQRWHPDDPKPDPTAVAACWSCHFQTRCALRALVNKEEFGIWGGYRLAPGPGLARSRRQLAIIAGLETGPPTSPGAEVAATLRGAELPDHVAAQVIPLKPRPLSRGRREFSQRVGQPANCANTG